MITMPIGFARAGAMALLFAGLSGAVLAQQTIYSCEMPDGSVVLETEMVSKKCQKVSETAAPPKPPVAATTPAAPAASGAANPAKTPALPTAAKAPTAAAPAQPAPAVAKTEGKLVVKAPLPPVKVPPKRANTETYRDLQVKQAETALRADDPEHGIVGAAPTSNSSRRYLMTDRAHYQKAIGATPQAPEPAQK